MKLNKNLILIIALVVVVLIVVSILVISRGNTSSEDEINNNDSLTQTETESISNQAADQPDSSPYPLMKQLKAAGFQCETYLLEDYWVEIGWASLSDDNINSHLKPILEEAFDEYQSYLCHDSSETETLDSLWLMSKANNIAILHWLMEVELADILNWSPPVVSDDATRDDSEDGDKERLKKSLEAVVWEPTTPLRATLCQADSLTNVKEDYQKEYDRLKRSNFITSGDHVLSPWPSPADANYPNYSFKDHTSRFETANIDYQKGFDYDICNS